MERCWLLFIRKLFASSSETEKCNTHWKQKLFTLNIKVLPLCSSHRVSKVPAFTLNSSSLLFWVALHFFKFYYNYCSSSWDFLHMSVSLFNYKWLQQAVGNQSSMLYVSTFIDQPPVTSRNNSTAIQGIHIFPSWLEVYIFTTYIQRFAFICFRGLIPNAFIFVLFFFEKMLYKDYFTVLLTEKKTADPSSMQQHVCPF